MLKPKYFSFSLLFLYKRNLFFVKPMQTLKAKEIKQSLYSSLTVVMEGNTSSSPELPTAVAGKETAGSPAPCRWNPTKEQINMLENLYRQGVRTPTAEQIQEITTRLQTYGHIEGKNVFYWFQNHKARQRQKQKQDHLSYFHQYLHHHHHHQQQQHQPVIFPMTRNPNVVYGQCYMPLSDLGFYTQYPKVLIPGSTTLKRRSSRTAKPKLTSSAGILAGGNTMVKSKMVNAKNYSHQETLDLFPLHPTGILQQKEAMARNENHHALTDCTSSSSDCSQDQLLFDFFSS